ncbi:MAG: mechanosensitive ion channel [Rubrivivax sp.]
MDPFIAAVQSAFGNHLMQILGAVAIFILGWLIAVAGRAAALRLLALMKLDQRIRESTGAPVQVERSVALGVFWLLMLVTVIAVMNVLDLATLSGPFALMMGDIMGYLPHLVAGLALSLVAWVAASLLRALVARALAATSLDERLSQQAGMAPMSRSAASVVFWLVLLMFLPSVLGAFRLEGTLRPVQDMLGHGLEMLPNVFAAAVIAFVGWLVARVLRGLVVNLLTAAGTDRLAEHAGIDGAVKLPRLAGTVVFLMVLVPSLIAALDALRIEAISGPATMMLSKLLAAVPNIIAAAVVLTLTWFVARFAAGLLARLLESAGFDAVPGRIGLVQVLSGATKPSRLAHAAVLFFAMLFAVVESASLLGFTQVSDLITNLIAFAGDIVLGGLILAIGFWLANLAYQAIDRASGGRSRGLAPIARMAILGLVIAMGLRAMGIANEIVQLAFGLTLGAVAVAVALSFGLGGREAAGELTRYWLARWRAGAAPAPAERLDEAGGGSDTEVR